MNERLKQIRAEAGLSMRAFAKRIGISDALVARMEAEGRTISERTIRLICSEFGVRREWLETGRGDMYEKKSEDAEAEAVLRRIGQEHNPVLRALATTWIQLTPDQQTELYRVARIFSERLRAAEEAGETVTLVDTLRDIQSKREREIDEKVELYRQQLELEARQDGRSLPSGESETG